ncbi:MAG: spore coat associated protein CotJA [Ruminococcaceae bacterium]|nr:spore coat associated protein CotJA [Oscillospiraceae bacterium]
MSGRSLAMVYSPCQEFEGLYEGAAALAAGTIFRELEKPFYGARRLK